MSLKRAYFGAAIVMALLALALVGVMVAGATDDGPEFVGPVYLLVGEDGNEEVFIFTAGTRTCVRVGDQLTCFCDCDSETCEVPIVITPGVERTPSPTDVPPEEKPPGPSPTPTTGTTPEPRQPCNRGIGNLSEDCDPGNSSGQGKGGGRPAGEDRGESQGPPGNQGR